jgi:hypothetical protein
MNVSWNGVVALLGCLIAAIIPLPKQAEGLRLGLFGAMLAFVLVDSARRRAKARDHELVPVMAEETGFSPANATSERAERLRRASRLLDPASDSAAAQWRRLGHLARSREGGIPSAA